MATIEELSKRVAALEAQMAKLKAAFGQGSGTEAGAALSDVELDADKYADFVVKYPPKSWTGPSFEGRKLSECSPEFLDSYAGYLEWKAKRDAADPAKAQKADYARKDAARCRGFARRLRAGWKSQQSLAVDDPFAHGDAGEDMPF